MTPFKFLKKKKVEKEEKEKEVKAESKTATVVMPKDRRKKVSGAWKILKAPHITEKATDLVKKNQYVFKVYSKTNKTEIRKAIEDLYGVEVLSVKIIKVPRKRRRLGRISGWRKGYKKAIVKIKEGQKIEVLPR
ncbi:MAG: 50S ribosomal protein L23 [Candidatus Paceibacterales bacterium]